MLAADAMALEQQATSRLFEKSRGASSGRRAIKYVVAGVRPKRSTCPTSSEVETTKATAPRPLGPSACASTVTATNCPAFVNTCWASTAAEPREMDAPAAGSLIDEPGVRVAAEPRSSASPAWPAPWVWHVSQVPIIRPRLLTGSRCTAVRACVRGALSLYARTATRAPANRPT